MKRGTMATSPCAVPIPERRFHRLVPRLDDNRLLKWFGSILAKANGRSQIDIADVAECEDLFLDARRSAALLSTEAGRGYLS